MQITDVVSAGIPGARGLPATGAAEDNSAIGQHISADGTPAAASVDGRIDRKLEAPLARVEQTEEDVADLVERLAARRTLGLIPAVGSTIDRDAMFPPVARRQGDKVDRIDKGYIERYYEAYDAATNPGGATPAGWYPVPGSVLYGELASNANSPFPAGGVTVPVNGLGAAPRLLGVTRNGSDLVVPITGFYEIVGKAYLTAVATFGAIYVGFGRPGEGLSAVYPRMLAGREASGVDVAYVFSGSAPLTAGDRIGMRILSFAGAGTVYGDPDNNGAGRPTLFSIRYLGPYQG